MLFLGLKPISTLVLTQGNAVLLICVLNDVRDTTDVVIQYYIMFIY